MTSTTAPVKKSAAAFSTAFYVIRNAASTDARNALIRRTHKQGADLSLLASAARVTVPTIRKIVK